MAHDKVSQEFGSLLFTDADMQERLPRPTYKKLRSVIQDGKPLDLDIANEVAHAMKEWALEKGATHFTHWFQPLTGITSEKHDSFMTPQGNGTILMSFSGKSWYRASLTHQASLLAVCVPLLRLAVTRFGILQAQLSSKMKSSAFQQHLFHTPEKLWISALLCFVPRLP